MNIYFTQEVSSEIRKKVEFVDTDRQAIDGFFRNKDYGEDLKVLTISIVGVHPKFANFLKPRKPKYQLEVKEFVEKGVLLVSEGKSLSYDLPLDYRKYLDDPHPKRSFALEVLGSLKTITEIK